MTALTDSLPLLAARDLAAPLAWRGGQAISAAQFLGEAQALAATLPSGRPVNLCQDRYLFALGLAAALLRGQTSLMPPNALPETLRQVPAGGAAPYLLMDADSAAEIAADSAAGTALPVLRVQRPAAQPASAVPLIPAALQAVCLLTSGSTGAPQPHAKHWANLVQNIGAEAARLAELMSRPSLAGVCLAATVPAQHSYGFESTVLLALLGGASFDAGRPFYPADIAHTLQALPQPRALVTTPFHLKTLLLAGVDLPPVALLLSATAPLSPQLAAQAEAAMGGPLVEIYGCTEAGQVAARRTTAGEVWATLGELRIHRETGPGGAALAGNGAERFIVSGGHVAEPTPLADVLELIDACHFRLLGRANDLIHVAGKRSSLAHLNYHLNRIEGVADGAFWLPDDVAEAVVRPLAFVVAPQRRAREIIEALRAHLEPAFVPRRVVHVTALPREATGKLTAAALREFALRTLAEAPTQARAPGGTPEVAVDSAEAGLAAAAAIDTAIVTAIVTAAGAGAGAEAAADIALFISANHSAFAGHFPGHPVLPGAVLLSLVLDALAQRPALVAKLGASPCIDNAKFLQAVPPQTALRLRLREQGTGVAFEIFNGPASVARGQLSAGTA